MSSSSPAPADSRRRSPLRVLVVDDSPEDRELYRRLLAHGGPVPVSVVDSETAAEALQRLATEPFDCILLDYQLPDGNGLELLLELQRCVDPFPAVILLTGHGDEGIAVEAMKRGAQDYLVKGRITGDGLTRAVQHAFEKVMLRRSIDARSVELLAANEELSREIRERERAERALQQAHQRLEEIVRERTHQLELTNMELRREVAERQSAELREREAREQAEHANQLKDEFLATVSHELRTPLNAILGWAAVLRAGRPDPATVERAAEVIERSSRAQAQLIADLLDMSAIVTGKLRLELAPVDVGAVLAAVEDTLRPSAVSKGIDLRFQVDADLPPLLADPSRLQQVVSNLLANAIKFTASGGRVTVGTRRREQRLEIAVSDNGMGIEESFLPFVFDRFRQQDSSTTRVHSGLGLGLAIVRHLVEAHGGSVTAESDGEGSGSTFRVLLPWRVAEPPPTGRDTATAAGPSSLAGVRVLVVDDEPDTRELCRVLLEASGATVEVVESAAAAWEALERSAPDVLVCDIGLPGEDGYSLLRRWRAQGEDGRREVPAVALTAYASAEDAERAKRAGFQVHLAKPVEPEVLVATLHRLCRRPV
jgi:signal transduction histidine kinase